MKSDSTHQYRYILIGDYWYCLQQNPAVLAWILLFKNNDLITIQPWRKKYYPQHSLEYFRYQWQIFNNNLLILFFFIRCLLGLKNPETIQLPFYGHFGMSVHKGYKIFNIRTRIVTKIFDPDADRSSISREIEQLKKVSAIDFAPSLKKCDIDQRWYQEEYIRSSIAVEHRSPDSLVLLKAFHDEALPCMQTLIFHTSPQIRNLDLYLRELESTLKTARLINENADTIEADTLIKFMGYIFDKFNAEDNRPVYFVLSHGDFCPANFLKTRHGLRVIDWEGAGQRSLLFDFFSYFFYRPVSPKFSLNVMAAEIDEAIPDILSGLSSKAPDMTNDILPSIRIYRWLYYLERLCMLVERDFTDRHLNMTDYMMRYIKAFYGYEELR